MAGADPESTGWTGVLVAAVAGLSAHAGYEAWQAFGAESRAAADEPAEAPTER